MFGNQSQISHFSFIIICNELISFSTNLQRKLYCKFNQEDRLLTFYGKIIKSRIIFICFIIFKLDNWECYKIWSRYEVYYFNIVLFWFFVEWRPFVSLISIFKRGSFINHWIDSTTNLLFISFSAVFLLFRNNFYLMLIFMSTFDKINEFF